MNFDQPPIPEKKQEEEKVVYKTKSSEISEVMKAKGYAGYFSVSVEDKGDSYGVSVDANFAEGIDPFNVLPTSGSMSKEKYTADDAKKEADRMHKELLESGDVFEKPL